MSINKEEIDSEITLEIDKVCISINEFQRASDNFLNLIKEISKNYYGAEIDLSGLVIQVYSGSAGVGVNSSKPFIDVNAIRTTIFNGISQLHTGERPPHFNDKVLEYLRNIGNLDNNPNELNRIRLLSKKGKQTVIIGKKLAENAKSILSAAYEEYSSVDGILETLNGRGKLQFKIYDLFDDHSIKCIINEKLLHVALENFQKRVEVSGKVKFRKDGTPIEVTADKIFSYPDESEIPTLQEVRNILSNSIVI